MCLKQVLPPSKRKRQHSEIKVHRLINSFISFPASKAGWVKSILAVWKRTGTCVFAVLPWNYQLHCKIFTSMAFSHKMSLTCQLIPHKWEKPIIYSWLSHFPRKWGHSSENQPLVMSQKEPRCLFSLPLWKVQQSISCERKLKISFFFRRLQTQG